MTEITFYTHVDDCVTYACRLLHKAVKQNARLVVVGAEMTLAHLDTALWTFVPNAFVPHCIRNELTIPSGLADASPVLLTTSLQDVARNYVVVNLGHEVPVQFEQFERLIEIVSTESSQRAAAVLRWQHYKSRGYTLKNHNTKVAV